MTLDIEKLAREAGAHKSAVTDAIGFRPDELAKFAALVLERAAQTADGLEAPESCTGIEKSLWDVATLATGDAIRAMKPQAKE